MGKGTRLNTIANRAALQPRPLCVSQPSIRRQPEENQAIVQPLSTVVHQADQPRIVFAEVETSLRGPKGEHREKSDGDGMTVREHEEKIERRPKGVTNSGFEETEDAKKGKCKQE
jgi:hypothetical protein